MRQCPYCGGSMERGRLGGSASPYFLPDHVKGQGRIAANKPGAIKFRWNVTGEEVVVAYTCRQCKKIIISYDDDVAVEK